MSGTVGLSFGLAPSLMQTVQKALNRFREIECWPKPIRFQAVTSLDSAVQIASLLLVVSSMPWPLVLTLPSQCG